MAIKLSNSTIIDDSRNIVDANVATFLQQLNVGSTGSILKVEVNTNLNDNILSVKREEDLPAFDITADGRVGIGTSSPQRSLEVVGDNGFAVKDSLSELFSVQPGQLNDNILEIFDVNDAKIFTISADGNVGIGKDPTTKKLDIGGGGGFSVSDATTELFSVETYTSDLTILDVFDTGGRRIFSIAAAPTFPNIYGTVNFGDGVSEFSVQPKENATEFNIGGNKMLTLSSSNSTELLIIENETTAQNFFTVSSTGNIGIGTRTPSSILEIVSNNIQLFSVSNTLGSPSLSIYNESNQASFFVSSTGNVGIGTATPSSLFEVFSGADQIFSVSSSDSVAELIVDGYIVVEYGYVVNDLTSISNPFAGQIVKVTDASSPVIGDTVTGGGASTVLCWYNGANWSVLGK